MRTRQSEVSGSMAASWAGLATYLVAPSLILWSRELGFFGKDPVFRILGPEIGFWIIVLLVGYVTYQ